MALGAGTWDAAFCTNHREERTKLDKKMEKEVVEEEEDEDDE